MKILIFFFIMLLVLLGCSDDNGANKLSSVRIGVQNNTASALIFIAAQRGFFKSNGLKAEIVQYPSGKIALQNMLKGNVDMAVSSDIPVTVNAIRNENFRILSTISKTTQGAWIIARADRAIDEPADLSGKTIGTQSNSAVHYFLWLFAEKYGIFDEITIKFIPAVNLVDSLETGTIDAFSMRNPFIKDAENRLKGNTIEFKESDLYIQNFLLLVNNEFMSDNQYTLNKVLKSLQDAEKLTIINQDNACKALCSYWEDKRNEEVEESWDKYDFEISLSQQLINLIEDEFQFAEHIGVPTQIDNVNIFNYIYIEPLQDIAPSKVSVYR